MPEAASKSDVNQRIMLSQSTCDSLKKAFPTATYDEAIQWMLSRYGEAVSDTVACGLTEQWIKMDRLEECLSLLACTNIDLADGYRRRVAGDLSRMKEVSCRLADKIATDSDHQKPL